MDKARLSKSDIYTFVYEEIDPYKHYFMLSLLLLLFVKYNY